MAKFVHLFSGGLDSTVLLYDLLDQEHHVECLLFHYGQRHAKELQFAGATCQKLYAGGEEPCGVCGACEARRAALA